MADVFISYKREDRELAAALDTRLQHEGISTWWDTSLVAGEQFNAAIAGALAEAKCIVVLWNHQSHASLYVQAEAIDGFNRKILVAARLDDVILRYPFHIIQTADLRSWDGNATHPGLAEIIAGVKLKLGQEPILPDHYSKIAPGAPIIGRTASPGDPSIWDDPGQGFAFQEASSFFHANRKLTIENGPRAYARIIPAGWSDGPLAVVEFARLAHAFELGAPSQIYDSGTYGFSYFGALHFWFSGHRYREQEGHVTQNACLYFDEIGEFWVVHGTAVQPADNSRHFVFPEPTIANWSRTLRQIMKVYDDHGASPERRVIFGVVGLDNAYWATGQHAVTYPRARKSSMIVDRQQVGWSENQQQDFLRLAYNELRGVFSLHKLDQKQFLADLNAFDSKRFSDAKG
jgi:hypothetical protein